MSGIIASRVGIFTPDGNFNHERLIEFVKAADSAAWAQGSCCAQTIWAYITVSGQGVAGPQFAQMEVFYLPSYSPEQNPDERLNASLKQAIATNGADEKQS